MSYYRPPKEALHSSRHAAVGAWFLGPKAENFCYLQKIFGTILEQQKKARIHFHDDDERFITSEMQDSSLFKEQMARLDFELSSISTMLAKHSIPFWSPRYNGHMNMDTSMPAIIGYMMTMLYNPNNVATEASPYATLVETEVGKDLCTMLGYNIQPNQQAPVAWGHITCDGSVANLESIWAARNLKFYPLSLMLAIKEGSLGFINSARPEFSIQLCTGHSKTFTTCSTWELLNLKPSTVLEIPHLLYNKHGVSQTFLADAMYPFLIQTVGKDYLEKRFNVQKPAQFYVGTTKHYSWPKGAAIAGIGSKNMVDVPIDLAARMDTKKLDKILANCVNPGEGKERTPVYAVIAIIGSTEQGAVDPLDEILKLRDKYEAEGLSFVVHCDGAWGGYFASMLHSPHNLASNRGNSDYVPTLALQPYTRRQLKAYKMADSITLDPHKSGYCPYPAGGLCYRDGRMRFLVTWTSPIVYRQEGLQEGLQDVESIGVYGVEGSKPGAAAVAAHLSHQVLGLDVNGYGTLLGEAIFSCTRLYCHWATMTTDESDLIVVPFNMLPAEKGLYPTPERVTEQKKFIRESIIDRDNSDIVKNREAVKLLAELGSDLMINAFACNFKIDGRTNHDIGEANYLNSRIFARLSAQSLKHDISKLELIVTSTSLAQSQYGACLHNFKRRLGLRGEQDLYVLVNVTMSPWPTAKNFLGTLAGKFRKVAEEEMKFAVKRNTIVPHFHGFILQETDRLYGTHLPMFNMANHRYQLIVTGEVPTEVLKKYNDARAKKPGQFFTMGNVQRTKLEDLIHDGASFEAVIDEGLPEDGKTHVAEGFKFSKIKIMLNRSLQSKDLNSVYPEKMSFFAYGTQNQAHIDHLLALSPNIQLNSDQCDLNLDQPIWTSLLQEGVWINFVDVNERSLQPLITTEAQQMGLDAPGCKFLPGQTHQIEVYRSYAESQKIDGQPLTAGSINLGKSVFVDSEMINMDGGMEVNGNDTLAFRLGNFGLAAEYPVPGQSTESNAQYRHGVMQGWKNEWEDTKQVVARNLLKDYLKSDEGGSGKLQGPPPQWLTACQSKEGSSHNEGEDELMTGPRPYHSRRH